MTYEDKLAALKSIILTAFYAQHPPSSVSCRVLCVRDDGPILARKPAELEVLAGNGAHFARCTILAADVLTPDILKMKIRSLLHVLQQ